jgi:hypothetical protein
MWTILWQYVKGIIAEILSYNNLIIYLAILLAPVGNTV